MDLVGAIPGFIQGPKQREIICTLLAYLTFSYLLVLIKEYGNMNIHITSIEYVPLFPCNPVRVGGSSSFSFRTSTLHFAALKKARSYLPKTGMVWSPIVDF